MCESRRRFVFDEHVGEYNLPIPANIPVTSPKQTAEVTLPSYFDLCPCGQQCHASDTDSYMDGLAIFSSIACDQSQICALSIGPVRINMGLSRDTSLALQENVIGLRGVPLRKATGGITLL